MAGTAEGGGYVYKGKNISKTEKQRQNDNHITGESWKQLRNTDFAYYSSMGRFCSSKGVDFPHSGAYLCTEEELKSEVNYLANIDNILNEAEGYTNVDYYTEWMEQEKQEEKDKG